MNSHDGGDVAKRLRCTHLSFDYARGKYPERVREDHTISERALRRGWKEGSLRSRGRGRGYFSTARLLDYDLPCRLPVWPSGRLTDFVQERQHPVLVRIKTGLALVAAIEEAKLATLVAKEDGGVDVRGAADCARVAEARSHVVNGGDDIRLHRGLALEGAPLAQGARGQDCAPPRAEVLGGECLPGCLSQIGVDILGADDMRDAVLVEVLEEMLPGKVLHPRDIARHAAIAHVDLVRLAALAAEGEVHRRSGDVDVVVAQGRQSVGVVVARVLRVADSDQRLVEQAHRDGEGLFTRKPG